tara:strand:+ start:164 stop:361 length:198 start_codon:yes stop_codon:yes gene_type:complete
MLEQSKKIIVWALGDADSYGGHIQALKNAIESGRVSSSVVSELNEKLNEWVSEQEAFLKVRLYGK